MWVKEAILSDFRNFDNLSAELSPGINLVYGDNANGKTNFIEAIFFCATGRSPRCYRIDELIRFGQREAHIKLTIEEGRCHTIDFHISDGKSASIDRVPIRKISELFGVLLVVSFMPDELNIVKGSPTGRRIFLDTQLCQISKTYYRFLKRYYQALKQRNSLLKAIPRDASLKDSLFIWDAPLCEAGTKIIEYRSKFVAQLNDYAAAIHAQITDSKEYMALEYRPNIPNDSYAERLARSTARDIQIGSTTVGIHKDDMLFHINGNNARIFGSQGQQRTAALSAKLATIELIKARTGYSPVLLLDDVLSELDESRQRFLLANLRDLQVIITCTGPVPGLQADKVFWMVDGKIFSTGYKV